MPASALSSSEAILTTTAYNLHYVVHMMMTTDYSQILGDSRSLSDTAVIFGLKSTTTSQSRFHTVLLD